MKRSLFLLTILVIVLAWPSTAQARLTFVTKLVISGVTLPAGDYTDPTTKVTFPNDSWIRVEIAREAGGAAYGRLQQSNANFTQWASTTAPKVDWTKITKTSATFKFRVQFKSLTDWAIYTIKQITLDGVVLWQVDVTIKDFYEKYTWLVRPTAYLPADAVKLTP